VAHWSGLVAWFALAQRIGKATNDIYEMRDARTCKGYEKSFAKCESLPSCTAACKPVSCAFSSWGKWYDAGGCSGLCLRHRSIEVSNNECGMPCVGAQIESKSCPKEDCLLKSEDCKLSHWSDWSACDSPVDQKYRHRSVLARPRGDGSPCTGNLNETRPCDTRHPVDCTFSEWGQWTECSATCDGGYQAAIRRVLRQAQHGGRPCEGTLRKTQPCHHRPCVAEQRDCEVGDWGSWLGCNFASPQQRYRTREVVMEAVGSGQACSSVMKQTAGCAMAEPRDCAFSDWSAWGRCDKTCGGGQMYRKRTLVAHNEHGGVCAQLSNLAETASCNTQPCSVPMACSLTLWSEWSTCSVSCDMGVRERSRKMFFGSADQRRLSLFDLFADSMVEAQTQQEALPLSEDCSSGFSGGLKEVAPCEMTTCFRQDCAWGLWTEWSACSCSCGGGTKRRNRVVAASPGKGGRPCMPEDSSEIEACNMQSCDECVDGVWGGWSDWSSCSATCGTGFRSRHRDVSQHPNHCGAPVTGVEDDFAPCDAAVACVPDADCQLSEWTPWTECSSECFGVTERHRHILSFPSGGGKPCSMEPLKELEACNPAPSAATPDGCAGAQAPSACQMAAWGDWGSCSVSCGDGQKIRLRSVLTPASKGGALCNDTLSETRACSSHPCPHQECLDCTYGDWEDWGKCSKCGGQRYRHRAIAQMPTACGRPCDIQDTKQAGACTSECEEERWCAWTEWSSFGECSAECGPATKSRQRTLAIFREEPLEFLFSGATGMTCEGLQLDSAACEYHSCTAECAATDCVLSEWSEWSSPSCSQLCERTRVIKTEGSCGGQACEGSLVETRRCGHACHKVQDCVLSSWQDWSECSSPHDQKYRKRMIQQDAENGGAPCEGGLSETQFCSTPGLSQPCELSSWSDWTSCTKSCFGGLKQRTRAVRRVAANGGEPCEGGLEELVVCNQGFCAGDVKDCEVGSWSTWGECSHNGQRARVRTVKEPRNGGAACEVGMHEIEECSQAVDCKLSDWSDWDSCDKTCAGGQQQRQRQVVQNPLAGGRACPASLMETRGCNEEPCNKVDCAVSDWGRWGECTATCGPGQRQRSRRILQEPQDGGLGCGLELSQLEACSNGPCEYVDCLWDHWSAWSDCSSPCDGGQRTRTRSIVKPSERGGKPCVPLSKEEVGACNTQKCSDETCVNGQWGDWGDWEKCSSSCEGGLTWRSRQVDVEANHCGQPANGEARVYASCNDDVPCIESVDCSFGDWGVWSACSLACGGIRRRSREIAVHGRGEGRFCLGPLKQTAPCNPGPGQEAPQACKGAPPVDCQIAEWSEWGVCSATCGGGSQVRSRELLVEPKNGGLQCADVLNEVRGCEQASCSRGCEPQDCTWDDWGEWSACDKCGGQMKRFRHVLREANCGGSACVALASEETANCTRQCHVPVYCMWGDWKEWSACSATCGHAEKSRTRHLTATSEPPLDLLEEYDGAHDVDEALLQDRVAALQRHTQNLRTRRLQRLSVAFAGGGVGLVAGLAALRALSRRGGVRFVRLPHEE